MYHQPSQLTTHIADIVTVGLAAYWHSSSWTYCLWKYLIYFSLFLKQGILAKWIRQANFKVYFLVDHAKSCGEEMD